MSINLTMSKFHQGSAIKKWIEQKYDSVNRLCVIISEQESPENQTARHSSLYSLISGISKKEFATRKNHIRWDEEIAPEVGYTLEEVIKEMGEKDDERSKGIVISDNSREVLVLRAENKTLREQLNRLSQNYNELFEKMLSRISPN